MPSGSDLHYWKELYYLCTNESYTLVEIAQCVCGFSAKYCETVIDYKQEPSHTVNNSILNY